MTIRIVEELEDYVINYDGREIRIDKPKTLKEVKKIAREHFEAVGKKVNWKII